ncbi:MAG: FAD/NAD(P)-binding protein [Bacteroidota bacterium]
MLDWLVVGGGVHGTHISHVLTQQLGVPRHRLRVVDPHPTPLHLWAQRTATVGMRFMRSPMVHHLDVHPFSLKHFASSAPIADWARFAYPFKRPSLTLFNAHSQRVVEAFDLDALRLTAAVTDVTTTDGGYLVETTQGQLATRRVVLAVGMGGLRYPNWAQQDAVSDRVAHIFDASFQREAIAPSDRVVVVGGGISAAQVAMACGKTTSQPVTLLQRHAPRIHQFDSDPGWMGPRHLTAFHQTPCTCTRRAMIAEARHAGSIPPQVHRDLKRAVRAQRVDVVQSMVTSAAVDVGGAVCFTLGDGSCLTADRVLLATGFATERPGGAWMERMVQRLGLRCAQCGFPIVTPDLAWRPGLHVTGALAELEVGPVARNIVGARLAADRLLAAA